METSTGNIKMAEQGNLVQPKKAVDSQNQATCNLTKAIGLSMLVFPSICLGYTV